MRHVIIRGIGSRKIFRDEDDREGMLDRLASAAPARRFSMTAAGVGHAVGWGEHIASKRGLRLDQESLLGF